MTNRSHYSTIHYILFYSTICFDFKYFTTSEYSTTTTKNPNGEMYSNSLISITSRIFRIISCDSWYFRFVLHFDETFVRVQNVKRDEQMCVHRSVSILRAVIEMFWSGRSMLVGVKAFTSAQRYNNVYEYRSETVVDTDLK